MSTLGREADRYAEQGRRRERRIAERRATLHDCVCFCIATLNDADVPDDVARKTTLEALKLGRTL